MCFKYLAIAVASATALIAQTTVINPIYGGGSAGGIWGNITGTLTDQTDLNTALGTKLIKSSNLLDLTSITTARTNLGLGSAAVQNNAFFLQTANNLSDVTAASARTNLGLGTAAVQTNAFFLQTSNNLSDVTASTARTNLGLGTAAVQANSFFLQTANNLSDVTAATARTNLGLGSFALLSALASTSLSDSSAVVRNNQANTYTAGFKQSVQSDATNAGFNFGGVSADPSSASSGDLWFRTDQKQINYSDGTVIKQLATVDQIPVVSPAGYSPNQSLIGCGVEYTTGLTYNIGACSYTINGLTYSSPLTAKTLTTADATNDRIDVIGVDNTGTVFLLTGTPGATPQQPTIDPSTQLELTFVYVAANASTPTNVTTDNIYDEGSEWTLTNTAHITNSTSNPRTGTHDLEATAAVLGNNSTLVKPASGTVDLATRNALVFYIRSKATWPTGTSGSTAARSLSIWWQNGSTQKGNQVVLRSGTFGFTSSQTSSYQQISIPTTLFGINGIPVTTLVIQVTGPSGSASIGYYIDTITLQGTSIVNPTPRYLHSFTFSINGGGSVIATGQQKQYFGSGWNCTISNASVIGGPSGSISVDILKKAGALPVSPTDKISASAPVTLTSSTVNFNNSVSTWTSTGKVVSVNDVLDVNVASATTVTSATVQVWCQE